MRNFAKRNFCGLFRAPLGRRVGERVVRWVRSLRFTPSFWYVSILSVVLVLFSVALYLIVAFSLTRDVDHTLVLQAEGAAESVFAFWRAERASAGFGPGNWSTAPSDTFAEELMEGPPSGLFSRWAEKTNYLDTERLLRLLDDDGQLLGASSGFIRFEIPVSETAIDQGRHGRNVYETLMVAGRRVRLLTHPVIESGKPLYLVQTAVDLGGISALRLRLRLLLLILIPSTLAVIGVAGFLLARMGREPITRLIAQTQRFVVEQLHEELEVTQTPDEVERLSAAFQEMLARLERSLRRLRQFSAAASHEQRTALTVMRGELDVTLRKPRDAQEYQQVLQKHLEAINEIAAATEELLRLAQWEAAEDTIRRDPVELGGLVQRTSEAFRPVADQKTVRLEVATNGPTWVQGQAHLLGRVIANLLDNAMKHTPAAGRITLLVECKGEHACVTIRDTGPGISPEELPHLFERFFKRQPTMEGVGSTGLGLGLCRWIIESHHGYIEVDSAPGQGAVFRVFLPLLPPPLLS